ncbi:GILT-like protein 1 [Cryptotermes secundus]|nr:GILT-like protein 1 [Cryptotermes secundus]
MTVSVKCIYFFSVIFLAVTGSESKQKVHVTVYYETLCPDSQRFIKFQLYPAWKDLRDHLILEFVPFGKSSGNRFDGFKCQHGERECRGNLMQSCALSLLNSSGPQMEFVYCVMSSVDGSQEGKRCSEKVGISWAAVDSCTKSTVGTTLQLMAQEETLKLAPLGLGFVPTITFNKKYSQQDQRDALQNFRGIACRYLGSPAPPGCQI